MKNKREYMHKIKETGRKKHSHSMFGKILLVITIVLLVGVFSACQSDGESPTNDVTPPSQDEQAPSSEETVDDNKDSSSSSSEPEPVDIPAAWEASPHANTFVITDDGHNMTCARCHAPINWIPSIDDIPDSCLSCKFEIDDPPPKVSEEDWEHIPCKYCHEVDKKGNVDPEVTWLEIPQIGSYSSVDSNTELCLKCHNEAELPDHGVANLGGAHADYECTDCHDAHSTQASCTGSGCHEDVMDAAKQIPGHDADHEIVACVACHDADGMEVGLDEESGLWTTFAVVLSPDGSEYTVPFTSHNIVLDAPCERCHYSGNPWGLSETVSSAP